MCVGVSVCPRSHGRNFNRFWLNLAQTSETWNERTISLGVKIQQGCPPILPHFTPNWHLQYIMRFQWECIDMSHFTQLIQPENKFIIRSSNWTGKFFFISFINKAWWFTSSKALLISIAQWITVLPFVTYPSTILRNARISACNPNLSWIRTGYRTTLTTTGIFLRNNIQRPLTKLD